MAVKESNGRRVIEAEGHLLNAEALLETLRGILEEYGTDQDRETVCSMVNRALCQLGAIHDQQRRAIGVLYHTPGADVRAAVIG